MPDRKITEAEHEVRRQSDEQNRSKEAFLATMSHEMRNPLNAILLPHALRFNRTAAAPRPAPPVWGGLNLTGELGEEGAVDEGQHDRHPQHQLSQPRLPTEHQQRAPIRRRGELLFDI